MNESSALVHHLAAAVSSHDLEAVVACFAQEYVNETPAHPGRGFVGRERVRTNWQSIFAGVPDLRADVLATATDGDHVWSEWEMRGTRLDGQPHLMRGVIIFTVGEQQLSAARFYLETVEPGEGGVDAAIATFAATAARP